MDKVCKDCGKSAPDVELIPMVDKQKRPFYRCPECFLNNICGDCTTRVNK
jgi:hypothetical protein